MAIIFGLLLKLGNNVRYFVKILSNFATGIDVKIS